MGVDSLLSWCWKSHLPEPDDEALSLRVLNRGPSDVLNRRLFTWASFTSIILSHIPWISRFDRRGRRLNLHCLNKGQGHKAPVVSASILTGDGQSTRFSSTSVSLSCYLVWNGAEPRFVVTAKENPCKESLGQLLASRYPNHTSQLPSVSQGQPQASKTESVGVLDDSWPVAQFARKRLSPLANNIQPLHRDTLSRLLRGNLETNSSTDSTFLSR